MPSPRPDPFPDALIELNRFMAQQGRPDRLGTLYPQQTGMLSHSKDADAASSHNAAA